ncbi:zinc dependent phospholipase C family protein [Aquirufa sp. TARAVU-A1A]
MKYLFLAVLLLANSSLMANWGFYAHKKINKLAIFTLPPPLINLYKRHLDEIINYAVLPDQRRHSLDKEAARHYIDLDRYNIKDIQNESWENAILKYSEDSLQKHGIVPWNIQTYFRQLKYAFIARDTIRIIKISAELGHYVADAHVPLHTTSNYDGQQTNQVGIHSFWESQIPELLQEKLDDWIGPAEYIPNLLRSSWDWVIESHGMLTDLFKGEKIINARVSDSHKYKLSQKGKRLEKMYTEHYIEAYHKQLDNQVEKRYLASIKHIGSLWYSAWLEAGEPDFK